MRQGLAAAGLNPEDVDYVNAHATGTPVGDVCEARILQAVFGPHCSRVPVSSTKSMTGHLLSAAAAGRGLGLPDGDGIWGHSADRQFGSSRSRVQSLPRGQCPPRAKSPRGGFQFLRLRRAQHVAGADGGGAVAGRLSAGGTGLWPVGRLRPPQARRLCHRIPE